MSRKGWVRICVFIQIHNKNISKNYERGKQNEILLIPSVFSRKCGIFADFVGKVSYHQLEKNLSNCMMK